MKSTTKHIRLSPEEARRLKRVAGRLGLDASSAIRYLVKLADDSARPSKPKPWGDVDHR
jgi:hypothetical protein